MDEIEADFLAWYKIFDLYNEPGLTGERFLRLSSQLPRYDGAVRRRIEMEQMEKQQSGDVDYDVDETGFTRGETMSMSEAVARSGGEKDKDMAVLDSLNRDSVNSQLGNLFEYETA